MRALRLLVALLAFAVAAPSIADAQVWKPKSRQGSAKTRKPTPKKMTKKKVITKKKPVAKKKKSKKKAKPSDDDFTYVEEDYPDE
jgi:Ni/Co efflux regulator RcnB